MASFCKRVADDMIKTMKITRKKKLFSVCNRHPIPCLYTGKDWGVYSEYFWKKVKYVPMGLDAGITLCISVHENHRTHRTFPMARPKCLMRDFTNLNRIYKAHRKNVSWIMKVFQVHWCMCSAHERWRYIATWSRCWTPTQNVSWYLLIPAVFAKRFSF